MTRKLINRRTTAGALTAALALGAAGPAAARQIDVTPQGSSVPAGSLPHYTKAVSHPAPGSDLTYVLVGGVVIAVAGLGGTLAATRRRAAGTATAARPRIAG
jgi:hypothetical protein